MVFWQELGIMTQANNSVERMRASRSRHLQSVSQWRLARTAHADPWSHGIAIWG